MRPKDTVAPVGSAGHATQSASSVGESQEATPWVSSADYGLSDLRPVRATLEASPALPGARYDMHFGLEFGVLLSGRMRRHYRSWETRIVPGQAWFSGMWERHGWQVSAGSCERLVFVILPTALHRARSRNLPGLDWMLPFRVPPRERPQAHGRQRQEILAIARRVGADLPGPDGSPLPLIAALELLLVLLGDWRPPARRYPPADESYYGTVEQAVEYALNTRGMVTTREVAAGCGMSSRVFGTVFEGLMGVSFAKFVVRHCLSEAARQLLSTSDSVAEIAVRCGFRHSSHFSHCFMRHYGVSPTEYRQTGLR